MFSNMSARECLRLHGSVPAEMIEDLLDKEDHLEAIEGVDAHIQEALCQYPAEDFLEGVKSRLHALAKNVRGTNRDEVNAIIEVLDDIAQCTFNSADYGRDELRKALKVFA